MFNILNQILIKGKILVDGIFDISEQYFLMNQYDGIV